jgi:tetratricopeptide (TPR) repeat protein
MHMPKFETDHGSKPTGASTRSKWVLFRWALVLALAGTIAAPAAYSEVGASNTASDIPSNLFGDYLSGKLARDDHDIGVAAKFYSDALAQDPTNPLLLEQTFLLEVAAAHWDQAITLAHQLIKAQPTHRIARFLLGCQAFKNGHYAAAEDDFSAAQQGPIADLASSLARAWVFQAEGKTDKALLALDGLNSADWAQFYQHYHRGLLEDLAGRHKQAGEAFKESFANSPTTVRIADAYARHAVNTGDRSLAVQILKTSIAKGGSNPMSEALLSQIQNGKTPPYLVRSANDGLAEVFYGIGDALASEGGLDTGVIFLQFAIYMEPNLEMAHLALAEAYDGAGKYGLEIGSLNQIPKTSPLWLNVEIQKALALNSLDKVDKAKTVLDGLIAQYPKDVRPLDALGNILRAHERYADALPYYTKAIDLTPHPSHDDWTLYYARGVCYERLNQWPKAQADLEHALKLSPDEPLVLNYLGYTWVDKDTNLKMGMDYIRKAVKLKPEDGYYVDSLGWAYYRLGDLQNAVSQMEHAVELKPDDPIINDHLGDVYWAVGRHLEAKYQWQQALDLKPEPADAARIKKKIIDGLPPQPETKAAERSTGDDHQTTQ